MYRGVSQYKYAYHKFPFKDRKGWYIGPGLYYADLTTQWKYNQTPPATGVPFFDASQGFGHDENRTLKY
jgi:hypothetical protein